MHLKSPLLTRTAALAAAFLGLTAGASAQSVSHTDSIPLMTTNWTNSVTIPRFDPNLGSLQSISFELQAFTQGAVQFESQDAQPTTVTLNFVVGISLMRPNSTILVTSTPALQQVAPVTAFDGTLDFGGTSGGSLPNLAQSATETHVSPRPLSDLALFTGPAGNPGTINLPVQALGQSQGSGAGNLTLIFMSQAGANVTVTYNYIPDCNNNGIPDGDDISTGASQDCNTNGIPDECEVPPDCNGNGVPDECEPDCNSNGVPDDCDIAAMTSPDANMDGVPDECAPADCKQLHRRRPGSLLLYPEFENEPGSLTLVTVTNTNCEFTGAPWVDNISVHFVYIDKDGCDEFDRTVTMTPCDTFSVLTRAHNPNAEEGYLYVYAQALNTSNPVSYNHLIGQLLVLNSLDAFEYSVNAVSFESPLLQGELTEINGNGLRDMNGIEYREAPDEILIPRFLGQCIPDVKFGGPMVPRLCVTSELILINLTGGAAFLTTVDFLIWNDNEQQFSAEYSFNCWDDPELLEISGVFGQDFLAGSADDPDEIVGAPYLESGWFRVNGALADSLAVSIPNPAIYAVLVEEMGTYVAADLPFEYCSQDNGSLLARNLLGNH